MHQMKAFVISTNPNSSPNLHPNLKPNEKFDLLPYMLMPVAHQGSILISTLYTRYPIVARALGLASREQRYLAYKFLPYFMWG